MTRTDILNRLSDFSKVETYLEIGVRNRADNMDKVKVHGPKSRKCVRGVDPALPHGAGIYSMTSADYWAGFWKTFDMIFIDGDHTYDGVVADIQGAAKCLAQGGWMVVHDCYPVSGEDTGKVKPKDGSAWCGEVWIAVYQLAHMARRHCIVNTDHGVGVFQFNGTLDFDPDARYGFDNRNVIQPGGFEAWLTTRK